MQHHPSLHFSYISISEWRKESTLYFKQTSPTLNISPAERRNGVLTRLPGNQRKVGREGKERHQFHFLDSSRARSSGKSVSTGICSLSHYSTFTRLLLESQPSTVAVRIHRVTLYYNFSVPECFQCLWLTWDEHNNPRSQRSFSISNFNPQSS